MNLTKYAFGLDRYGIILQARVIVRETKKLWKVQYEDSDKHTGYLLSWDTNLKKNDRRLFDTLDAAKKAFIEHLHSRKLELQKQIAYTSKLIRKLEK